MSATPPAVADALLILDRLRSDAIESFNKAYEDDNTETALANIEAYLTKAASIWDANDLAEVLLDVVIAVTTAGAGRDALFAAVGYEPAE